MLNTNIPKLEHQKTNNLEGMLTKEEAGQTLKNMKIITSQLKVDFQQSFKKKYFGNIWDILLYGQ